MRKTGGLSPDPSAPPPAPIKRAPVPKSSNSTSIQQKPKPITPPGRTKKASSSSQPGETDQPGKAADQTGKPRTSNIRTNTESIRVEDNPIIQGKNRKKLQKKTYIHVLYIHTYMYYILKQN